MNPHPVCFFSIGHVHHETNFYCDSPGLDFVSTTKAVSVLHSLPHGPNSPTAVLATIHQLSSQIYRIFDLVVLLSGRRTLYEGLRGYAPADCFPQQGSTCAPGYNVADHLLDLAHGMPGQPDSTSVGHKEYANWQRLRARGYNEEGYKALGFAPFGAVILVCQITITCCSERERNRCARRRVLHH